jgi:hypothetical protein
MTPLRLLSTLLGLALVGCGDVESGTNSKNFAVSLRKPTDSAVSAKSAVRAEAPTTPPASPAPPGQMGAMKGSFTSAAAAGLVAAQPGAASAAAGPEAIARKIIYDADVDLVVDNVEPIAKKVVTLVQQFRGYIAEQTITGSPGSQRSLRWRVRIPVDQFDSFVDSVVALGELERNNRTSQDVTEQYYDLEARIKNKKVEEQTLNKILQERSGKLEDVLKIEIELSRVRGEIEQLEGKIRVLENLSSLATLTLNVRERVKYEPLPPVVADFPTQIGRAWAASWLGMVNLGKALVLWAVSWAIWVPLFIVGGLIAWLTLRWLVGVFMRNLPRLVEVARTPLTPPRRPTGGG